MVLSNTIQQWIQIPDTKTRIHLNTIHFSDRYWIALTIRTWLFAQLSSTIQKLDNLKLNCPIFRLWLECQTFNNQTLFYHSNSGQVQYSDSDSHSIFLVMHIPVSVFQNLIHLSAVPPPDARSPWWWGDQAMALTAAMWSVNVYTGWLVSGAWTKLLII